MPADPTPNSGDVSRGLRPLAQEGNSACPFCGGRVQIDCTSRLGPQWKAWCVECRAELPYAQTHDLAAALWNRRAARPAAAAPAPPPPPTQAEWIDHYCMARFTRPDGVRIFGKGLTHEEASADLAKRIAQATAFEQDDPMPDWSALPADPPQASALEAEWIAKGLDWRESIAPHRDDNVCGVCGAPWGTRHSETCRNVPLGKERPGSDAQPTTFLIPGDQFSADQIRKIIDATNEPGT